MSIDYIVSSLPALKFEDAAPVTWEKFAESCGGIAAAEALAATPEWTDLETQLRNAVAAARGGTGFVRPSDGCSLYWQKRILDCFGERDVLRRDELIDRVWWDAAGELTPPSSPLGRGALATYAIRLKITIKRSKISKSLGNAAFDRLTAPTRRDSP